MLVTILLAAWLPGGDSGAKFTLFFTGEVQGNFQPCGCAAGPTGGLARRLGYSREFQREHEVPILQVDLGNYHAPPGPHATRINRLMWESLKALPLDVANLGADDLYYWDELSRLEHVPTQIISTNLSPAQPGVPEPKRFAVVEIPAAELGLGRPLKIGFLGVAWPSRVRPNSHFRAEDPVDAVSRKAAELNDEVDFIIVLAEFNLRNDREQTAAEKIAEENPSVYAILSTERRFMLRDPKMVNNAVILSSVERGRYLGQLTFVLDDEGGVVEVEPEFIELKDGVAEDAALAAEQKRLSAVLQ